VPSMPRTRTGPAQPGHADARSDATSAHTDRQAGVQICTSSARTVPQVRPLAALGRSRLLVDAAWSPLHGDLFSANIKTRSSHVRGLRKDVATATTVPTL
jgi:hypothetical protein